MKDATPFSTVLVIWMTLETNPRAALLLDIDADIALSETAAASSPFTMLAQAFTLSLHSWASLWFTVTPFQSSSPLLKRISLGVRPLRGRVGV